MPVSPRPWWKARPALIGVAVVAAGLAAGGVWIATDGDGPDSGPKGASALLRDEASQRQALTMINDAVGLGAVQMSGAPSDSISTPAAKSGSTTSTRTTQDRGVSTRYEPTER